ncbi:hypothetical protein K402DRAFT_456926 [Aulographum hederae CBS 113979]|uniref:RING-type domain-containing protein n=1 Tax=Aulographum hederae CBS 113979 TaxID=1176131 RepID=A0A6G1GQ86_9PEZI|nr:hypothetical protein K402DRAFT_456926 [Aulographum hederae CBS 113979]
MDDREAWKICFEVNLAFHTLTPPGQWSCLVCGKQEAIADQRLGQFRSDFVCTAIDCSKSHVKGWSPKHSRLCSVCDQEVVLDVTRRKQRCFESGCRRWLQVDREAVAERLKDGTALEKYFDLLDDSKLECQLCGEIVERVGGSLRPPTRLCDHDATTCNDCTESLLRSNIGNGNWQSIKCPDAECRKVFTKEDVRSFAQSDTFKETFRKYTKLLNEQAMSNNPKFVWCPTNCGNGQIHEAGELDPEWRCLKCNNLNCFNCRDSGIVCNWHKQRRAKILAALSRARVSPENAAQASADEKMLEKLTKRCPFKGCGSRIYFDGNKCNHMRCSGAHGCGIAFCYECKVLMSCAPRSTCHGNNCLWDVAHLKGCSVGLASRIPAVSKLPLARDSRYREGWDLDPGYEGARKFKGVE